ncbi:hypothetical protein BGZ94_004941, partial [Podila epigama]
EWTDDHLGGLDLLLKAAQKSANQPASTKRSKVPSMTLVGSYDTPVIIGRGSQATLNLGRINKQVSRRHAIVEWNRELSSFQITVLGQNGVRINGSGFPSGQQATLQSGDIVDLVGVKMLFRPPTEPASFDNTIPMTVPQLSNDDFEQLFSPGLETPKRARTQGQPYQLASPVHSSPIRDGFSAPSPQVTPTARMRHKMLKYEMGLSAARNALRSPPPSDPATDYDFSPVRPKPLFDLPLSALPTQKMLSMPAPKDKSNIFLTDDSEEVLDLLKQSQRVPLGTLKVTENNTNIQGTTESISSITSNSNSTSATTPKSYKAGAENKSDHSTSSYGKDIQKRPLETAAKSAHKENMTESTKQKSSISKTTQALSAQSSKSPLTTHTSSEKMRHTSRENVDTEKNVSKKTMSQPKESVTKRTSESHSKTKRDALESKQESAKIKSESTKVKSESSKVNKSESTKVNKSETAKTTQEAAKNRPESSKPKHESSAIKQITDQDRPKSKHGSEIKSNSSKEEEEKKTQLSEENKSLVEEEEEEQPLKKTAVDYTEMIIDTLVFARKK